MAAKQAKVKASATKPRKYAAKAKFSSFAADTSFNFGANATKKPSGKVKGGGSYSE